jgi:MFS family permease
MISGAFSLSMIMEGLVGIAMGVLNDKFGPRIVLTVCGSLVGLGCLLMSQIAAGWQLYLFFGIIIGMGMSGAWIPLTSTIARWFVLRRGIMTGFVLSGVGVSGLITPPVANWLISTTEWRRAFGIMGLTVFVMVILLAQLLRRDPFQVGQVPYGSIKSDNPKSSSEPSEKGYSFREALLVRQFWLIVPMLFCFGFCMFTTIVHIVPHATDMNTSAASAAKLLAVIGGIAIFGRIFLGSLADRIGSRSIFIIGLTLMSAAFFLLVPARELWMFYIFAVTFGFMQGGMGASESLLVADIFGLRSFGLIYGVAGCGFTLGAAIGPWVGGFVFDITGKYQPVFLGCALVAIIGLILTVCIRPIRG